MASASSASLRESEWGRGAGGLGDAVPQKLITFSGDTIEIHRNRAVYVSLNSLLMLTPHLTLILILTLTLILTLNLILTLTLTLSERNAFLWRPVNYNLAHFLN